MKVSMNLNRLNFQKQIVMKLNKMQFLSIINQNNSKKISKTIQILNITIDQVYLKIYKPLMTYFKINQFYTTYLENQYQILLLMKKKAKDHEDIQKQLVDYYKTAFVIQKKAKMKHYKEYIFNPLMILIKGTYLEIKQQAIAILSSLKYWLNPQQKSELIKIALQMSHNNDQENKIVSIQLIAKMTPDLSSEENQKLFLEEYSKIYNDSSVRVKKQIITELQVIGLNVKIQFFEKQIIEKFYLQKCQEKVWGVRKACVQIMPQLVKITKNKKELLVNVLINLIKDGNKIVKVSAYKIIPEFLANYESEQMPSKLMEIYLKLMDHEVNSLVSRQNEILNKVAFFFPGVLFRAGKKSWQQMRKLFERLLHHRNQEIKKPLASSLHQISEIIGPQLSKEYMFSALDTILKDRSDSLKLSAIDHLSNFVKLFDTTTRQNLIDVFLVLQKDPKKWRVRYSIAHQLEDLSKIYQTQTVFKYIFPISLKLCNDNVAQVRNQAAQQVFYVIDNLKSIQIYEEMAIESVKGYGVSQKFIQRQTFSTMIKNLYKLECFENKFMDVIEELAQDQITVVRIALAISIIKAIKQSPSMKIKFKKIIEILKSDKQVAEQFEQNLVD